MKFLRFLVVACVGVLVLLGGRLCDAQVSEFADRLDEGADRLQPLNAWIHYDEYGHKYTSEQISDLIAAAENDRMSGTALLNWLERTKQTLDKDLERQRSQAGLLSNAAVAPSYEQQRQAHRLRTRDLERRAQAAQAALDCYRDGDCTAIRGIDEDRARWRRDGDPLPQDPSVPGAGDMRELLADALRRHRSTIDDYRKKIGALKRDTLELTDTFNDFTLKLEDAEDEGAKLAALVKTLRERKEEGKKLCATVRAQHEVAATGAKNADTECSTAVASIDSARAGAAACHTPADADAVERAYGAAKRAHKAMGSHVKAADEALRRAREASTEWERLTNVDSEQTHARSAADDVQSSVDDGRVPLDFAAAAQKRLVTARSDVATIVSTLASLVFIDDEARSWQRALADDATTQVKAKAEFSSLRSEYESLRAEAKVWIDRLAELEARIGDFSRLEPLLDDAGLAAAKDADTIRGWRLPECDPEPTLDLRGKRLKLGELERMLAASKDLLDTARACRSTAGAGGSTSPPSSPSSSATSPATSPPPPVPVPSTPAAPPPPERYGGLVIAGLPARQMAVGDAVQLSAADHGGRPYAGAEWVCSNQQVATLTASGVLIARQAGSVTVLAKHDGMHAFLDVTIDAPATSNVSPQPPNRSASGGSPGPGSGSRDPGSGELPATPPGGGDGDEGDGLPGSSGDGTAPGGDSQTGSEPPGGEIGGEDLPNTTGGSEQVGGWSEGPPPVPGSTPSGEAGDGASPGSPSGFEEEGGWSVGPPLSDETAGGDTGTPEEPIRPSGSDLSLLGQPVNTSAAAPATPAAGGAAQVECSGELAGTWWKPEGWWNVVRWTKNGNRYQGVYARMAPFWQRKHRPVDAVYKAVQRVDRHNYEGREHLPWTEHKYEPLKIRVAGDYYSDSPDAGQPWVGINIWQRVAPADIPRIRGVKNSLGQVQFVVPGQPRLGTWESPPDCLEGAAGSGPGSGPGPGGGTAGPSGPGGGGNVPTPGGAAGGGREEGSCMVACRQGVQPPKCAVACDGETDTAFGKLFNHDYRSLEFGPASWEACAQRMRELDQEDW